MGEGSQNFGLMFWCEFEKWKQQHEDEGDPSMGAFCCVLSSFFGGGGINHQVKSLHMNPEDWTKESRGAGHRATGPRSRSFGVWGSTE